MLDQLTARQLSEWFAYSVLEPFESEKSDFKDSFLASLITNIAIRTSGRRGAKLTSVSDFEFKWDQEAGQGKQQSVEEMKDIFDALASASKEKENFKNKRIRRKPKRLKK